MPALALQIHRHQRFSKTGGLHAAVALAITDKGSAIKDQLILPPHQIAIQHRQPGFPATGLHLGKTLIRFVGTIRGRIQIQHQVRTGLLQLDCRAIVPDVFTDGDAQRPALDIKGADIHARLKIALFIKYPVIGQMLLEILMTGAGLTGKHHAGRITAMPIAHRRIAQHHGHRNRRTNVGQRRINPAVQAGTQQQVFRRVTGEHQLREQYKVRAQQSARFVCRGNNALGVPFDIAHQRVLLGHNNSHDQPAFPQVSADCTL